MKNIVRITQRNISNKSWKPSHPLLSWWHHKTERFPKYETKDILEEPQLSYKAIVKSIECQAKNSVLFRVDASQKLSEDQLQDALKKFIRKVSPYNYFGKACSKELDKFRFYLVEFPDKTGVRAFEQETPGGPNLRIASIKPGFHLNLMKLNDEKVCLQKQDLAHFDMKKLQKCEDMSDQMETFFVQLSPSSKNLRQKFFVSSLLDDFYAYHMNKSFTIFPYGTVMSNFSSVRSDIDVSLTEFSYGDERHNILSLNNVTHSSAVKYKSLHRAGALQLFEQSVELLPKFLPDVSNLEVIPGRVPLIAFTFNPLEVNVELSLNNRSAVQMGWCINMYSRMDCRVAPLTFVIREWARQECITNHGSPNYQGLTPFMLTSLILFYLMRIQPFVIPPMSHLLAKGNRPDDWVLGGFRTKLNQRLWTIESTTNSMSLEQLFIGFLEYYRRIDFSKRSFSLVKGHTLANTRPRYLTVSSPLHAYDGNIGKKCTISELNKFQRKCEITLRRLEDRQSKYSGYEDWGLLSILDKNKL